MLSWLLVQMSDIRLWQTVTFNNNHFIWPSWQSKSLLYCIFYFSEHLFLMHGHLLYLQNLQKPEFKLDDVLQYLEVYYCLHKCQIECSYLSLLCGCFSWLFHRTLGIVDKMSDRITANKTLQIKPNQMIAWNGVNTVQGFYFLFCVCTQSLIISRPMCTLRYAYLDLFCCCEINVFSFPLLPCIFFVKLSLVCLLAQNSQLFKVLYNAWTY